MVRFRGKKIISIVLTFLLFFGSLLAFSPGVYANSILGNNFYKQDYELVPGAMLTKENYENNGRNTAVNYIKADINHSNISVELAINEPFNRLLPISEFVKKYTIPEEGRYVLGNINASFFFTNGSGLPTNLVAINNEIYRLGTHPASADQPMNQRFAFGVNKYGSPMIDSYQEKMEVIFHGKSIPFQSFNTYRINNEIRLYTPTLGQQVDVGVGSSFAEIVVENANHDMSKMVSFGDYVTGIVKEIKINTKTYTPIPEDGFVIAVDGEELVEQFSDLQVGDELSYQISIDEKWMDSQSMIATGPMLVKDGKVSISMNESSSFARTRHPRSAVGITSNNELLLVTVDGRQEGYSNGISLRDLANYMISLGAVSAINLDGGGSTSITARLRGFELAQLVNNPSDGRGRSVSNVIQIVSSAPPVEVGETTISLASTRNLNNWSSSFTRGEGDVSIVSHSSSENQDHSVKLSYDFTSNKVSGTSAAYLNLKQPIMLEGKPDRIGMWVYGDGRENWLRMHLKDGNSKLHYVNFTEENGLNWSGWKYVTAKIPKNLPEPYSISSLYIAQAFESKKSMGNIYLNNLEAIYDESYLPDESSKPAFDPLTNSFPDVSESYWGAKSIAYLANQKVINGMPDGRFKPDGNITREQAAVMIAKQLNLNTSNPENVEFADINEESFFYKYVAAVANAGLMLGKKEGLFSPKDILTRAEAAEILVRAYQLTGGSEQEQPFSDVIEDYWAYDSITTLADKEIAKGYTDGTFKPANPVSRAAFASFLHRTITLTD